MDKEYKFQEDRITVRRDVYNASKKNKGGAAFNIVSLDYDKNTAGQKLCNIDNDAKVRALCRSKVLDRKNNGQYNILTGIERPPVPVPHHNRYNPITNAGAAVMSSGS